MIYTKIRIDQSGQETDLHETDSSYVEKDTVIGGHTFYKLRRHYDINLSGSAFLRDSLQYMIGPGGHIVFSSQDFYTVLSNEYAIDQPAGDTLYKITQSMTDKDLPVTVPAGSFTTVNFQTTYVFYHAMGTEIISPRSMNVRYAKNIGIITETEPFYSSIPTVVERRLLRYHVE